MTLERKRTITVPGIGGVGGYLGAKLDDFRRGGETEADSLAGHVVTPGNPLSVPTPAYTDIYPELKRIILERRKGC